MNFLAHAVFAERRSDAPAYVLGSMLPDFAAMAGLRIAAVDDEVLRRGVEFHHTGDDAFHGAPMFVEMMGEARDWLEEREVSLGPAMAVSHVGIELLLDGWLVERHGASPYRDAMADAMGLAPAIRWTRPEGDERWRGMIERLVAAPVPEGYVEPEFVADRLERILSRRPRLALDDREAIVVERWAVEARESLWPRAEALMRQVEDRLQAAEKSAP